MLVRCFHRATARSVRCTDARPQRLLRSQIPWQNHPRLQLRSFNVSRINTSPQSQGYSQQASFFGAATGAVKSHPYVGGFVVVVLAGLVASIGWTAYENMRIRKAFAAYPERVQKPFARAVYFSEFRKDPQRALKAYQEALFACEEAGLHPLSDLYMGLVGQFATFLAKHNNLEGAMELLESSRVQCLEWLSQNDLAPETAEQRGRLIGKVMGLSNMAVVMFQDEYKTYPNTTEGLLTEALELMLKEKKACGKMGLKVDAISDEEIGGLMDVTAHFYVATRQPELAIPLYLKSLEFCPKDSCRSLLQRSNIAHSLLLSKEVNANQKWPQGMPSHDEQISMWCNSAIELYRKLPDQQQKDSDCESGYILASFLSASVAEASGEWEKALEHFEQLSDLFATRKPQPSDHEAIDGISVEAKEKATELKKKVEARKGDEK